MKSDEDILEAGGTQEDIEQYAHDVGGACAAPWGYCDFCGEDYTKNDPQQKPRVGERS